MSSKTTWELDLKTLINEVFQEPDLSKRWYLVIDNESRRCSAFFRHRHVSYVDCLEKNSMDPEKLRLIILNSLRHGGTIIFDFFDSDKTMFPLLKESLSKIKPDLFELLIATKNILKDETFLELVKSSDGDDFKAYNFIQETYNKFNIIFLTTNQNPVDELVKLTQSIRCI